MPLLDELRYFGSAATLLHEHVPAGALIVWLGRPRPDITLDPAARNWLVRARQAPPSQTPVLRSWDAELDELDIPVPGVGTVRITCRPFGPLEGVDAVVHATVGADDRRPAVPAYNVRRSTTLVPAVLVWAALRKLRGAR